MIIVIYVGIDDMRFCELLNGKIINCDFSVLQLKMKIIKYESDNNIKKYILKIKDSIIR